MTRGSARSPTARWPWKPESSMSKRLWIVRGLATLAFGSTAVFMKPSLLPDNDPSPSYERPRAAHAPAPAVVPRPRMVVCSGRVESIHGEVDVAALIAG